MKKAVNTKRGLIQSFWINNSWKLKHADYKEVSEWSQMAQKDI